MFQQITRQDGREYLCGHGKGVVIPGVFADVAGRGNLHDHREGVDIDCRPGEADDAEEDVHRCMVTIVKGGAQIA